MPEVDAMEFYQQVTSGESKTEEYILQDQSNRELRIELSVVDRKKLLDEISRLPDEMLETLSEADDEDEAQELAEERNMLSGVTGDTVLAFENICVESMQHPELTRHNFADIVQELSFEVLFEIGSKVIELSFEEQGSIKDFREADSAKNS